MRNTSSTSSTMEQVTLTVTFDMALVNASFLVEHLQELEGVESIGIDFS